MFDSSEAPEPLPDGPRPSAGEIRAALSTLGHDRFRPGQEEAIDALFRDGRLLLVAPTGGGKSLTYQLPALLFEGTTLVISPLISLMHDQVSALEECGIAATFLASTLSEDALQERLRGISAGRYKLVYVAPERLSFPAFRALASRLRCPLIAIDEAHCISEWGHDFRPDYMQIGGFLRELPEARVLACTATATPVVRDEILERLGLPPNTQQIIKGFARPNLSLRAREIAGKKERHQEVDEALHEALGEPGSQRGSAIVYSPTRRITEDEADRLLDRGWRVAAYHAGLTGERREAVHQAFSEGELEVVVATNAFGMGIDRADVRGVIHLAPPGSIESYYQEVGRAGRDGEDALGLMLVSPTDMPRRRHLIESDTSGAISSQASIEHKWNLFLELMRFAEGGSCRHDAILRYFGDEDETLAGCGRCDVCVRLTGDEDPEHSPDEILLIVRKALSSVARIHGRFGLGAAVALLRGANDERLERIGLHRTPTFGILAEFTADWLTRLMRRCVSAGWVDFVGGDRPVVVLTEDGAAVMRGDRPIHFILPPRKRVASRRSGSGPKRAAGGAAAHSDPILSAAEQDIFEALRQHRLETAREEGVPPYVVASDRTLREVAMTRPRDRSELLQVHGIGANKADRYGEGLLKIIARMASAAGSAGG